VEDIFKNEDGVALLGTETQRKDAICLKSIQSLKNIILLTLRKVSVVSVLIARFEGYT